jgi:hypothetical protein
MACHSQSNSIFPLNRVPLGRRDLDLLEAFCAVADGPLPYPRWSGALLWTVRRPIAKVPKVLTPREPDLGIISVWSKRVPTHFLATPLGTKHRIYQIKSIRLNLLGYIY